MKIIQASYIKWNTENLVFNVLTLALKSSSVKYLV